MRLVYLWLLVVAVSAKNLNHINSPWKAHTVYEYLLQGHILSTSDEASGLSTKAVFRCGVTLQIKSEDIVVGKVTLTEYKVFYTNHSNAFTSLITNGRLPRLENPLSNIPFELNYKHGIIKSLVVEMDIETWELNFIKGIVSQLQVDTKAEDFQQKQTTKDVPHTDRIHYVYETMEESIQGKCKTLYEVYNRPEFKENDNSSFTFDSQRIYINKTINFNKCQAEPDCDIWIPGISNLEGEDKEMKSSWDRSTVNRMVVLKNSNHYTVESVLSTSKFAISSCEKQNVQIVSLLNLTTVKVKTAFENSSHSFKYPITIDSLLYKCTISSFLQIEQKDNEEFIESNTLKSTKTKPKSLIYFKKVFNKKSKNIKTMLNKGQQNKTIARYSRSTHKFMNQEGKAHTNNREPKNKDPTSQKHDRDLEREEMSSSNSSDTHKETNYNINKEYRYPLRFANSSDYSSYKFVFQESSSSSDSTSSLESSEEVIWRPKSNLSQPPNIPFLPMFIGNGGNSAQSFKGIKSVVATVRVVHLIAEEIQNPSAIPGQQTLNKFSILVQNLRTMSFKQMRDVTEELHHPLSMMSSSSAPDAQNYISWVVFRDAVALAGTGPALSIVKEWILSRKVEGEEAAEVLSVLPHSVQALDANYIKALFDLTTSFQVSEQNFLNTSAIMAFTELVHKAFVSRTKTYKTFSLGASGEVKKGDPVEQVYLNHFTHQLKDAVSLSDSNKIITMIMALGNLAHPRIMNVFAPYLENKSLMTSFQRLTVVTALQKTSKVFPKVVLPFLYKIYENTEEESELRVGAVLQIMSSSPPARLLQRMAQFTNYDKDIQVISAVQSAIRNAATNLKSPQDYQMKSNAEAAVGFLIQREFPLHNSKKMLWSDSAEHLNLGYKLSLDYIASKDSFTPSNIFYYLGFNSGSHKHAPASFSVMSSSMERLTNLLANQLFEPSSTQRQKKERLYDKSKPEGDPTTWSNEDISNILNVEPRGEKQLEAGLFISSMLTGKRLFAIDEHIIKQTHQALRDAAIALQSGQHLDYLKLSDKLSVTVAFPTAMGLPFVFSLTTPTLLHAQGHLQTHECPELQVNSDSSSSESPFTTVNITAEFHFVYSARTQSQMGFVTPFSHKHYVAGVSKNFHINIPFRTNLTLDLMNRKVSARVQPLDQLRKQNLFEYSTLPFTAKRDILEMVENPQEQIQNNSNSFIVHFRRPEKTYKTVGQDSTGFAFDFHYYSEQKASDVFGTFDKAWNQQGPIRSMIFSLADEDIALKNITLAYSTEKTTAEHAEFTAALLDDSNEVEDIVNGEDHQVKNTSESFVAAISSELDPKSRQQQFLRSAMHGIQDSAAMVVDLTAEFQGQNTALFVGTFGAATSFTSPKARYLFFAGVNPANRKKSQVCWAIETTTPNVPLMNFNESINADPTSNLEAELYFGEKCDNVSSKVVLKGKMERSVGRKQYVRQSPLAQLCENQMMGGNSAQFACQAATIAANTLNRYNFSVQFQKIPDYWKDAAYKAYGIMRQTVNQYLDEDLISQNKSDIEASLSPDLESLNLTINAPVLSAQFTNIHVKEYIQPLIAMHPQYSASERVAEYAFSGQHFSTCVVDGSVAETFDNTSYPLTLGNCWHVMLHYDPFTDSNDNNNNGVSILVRDAVSIPTNKDVAVIVGKNTIALEATRIKGSGLVRVNGQVIPLSKTSLSQIPDKDGNALASVYSLPSEAVRLFLINDVEVQFDGVAVKIRVKNSYRSKVVGLCGTFTNQPSDDFTTPQGCVVQSPFEFAAAYSLNTNSCQGSHKGYNDVENEQVLHSYDTVFTRRINNTLASKTNAGPLDVTVKPTTKGRGRSKVRTKHTQQPTATKPFCSQRHIQMVDKEGKRCVSLRPQLQCLKRCSKQKSLKKQVEFVCVDPSPDSHHLKEMILKEDSSELGRKKLYKSFIVNNIPENCSTE